MPTCALCFAMLAASGLMLCASSAEAGRYGGYRFVGPRIIENIPVAPLQLAPPPAPRPNAPQRVVALQPDEGRPTEQEATKTQETPPVPVNKPSVGVHHVGTWLAQVGTQLRVRLALNTDRTFHWSAANRGKTIQFVGVFSLVDGRLTLTREDGNSLTLICKERPVGFNLRAPDAEDAGLEFVPE